MEAERDKAKRSIKSAINSTYDERYPSQGINYSDLPSDVRIEESVAAEILDRTMQYREREIYRQYDLMTSHASRVENQTNAIIEDLSDQLEDVSLQDVSTILESHIEEQVPMYIERQFSNYHLGPDIEEDYDNTLTPDVNTSWEDTLTEKYEADGSGIFNISNDNVKPASSNELKEDKKEMYNIKSDEDTEKIEEANIKIPEESEAKISDGMKENMSETDKIKTDTRKPSKKSLNEAGDTEIFVDCTEVPNASSDCTNETYSLEMKLALNIDEKK